MATKRLVCKVYDVGQGACNFFELYDSTDMKKPPTHTILIDCGSRQASEAAESAIQLISSTLAGMKKPTIDTLILTHSDKDHVNFVKPLLFKFLPPGAVDKDDPKPNLGINKAYFGGDHAKYSKKKTGYPPNVLTAVKWYMNSDDKNPAPVPIGLGPDQTGYDEATKRWTAFREVDDVKLYLLAGNTMTANVDIFAEGAPKEAKGAYLKNMVSLVVIVSFAGVSIVVSGDATALTMARCNQVLNKSGPLPDTFMLTLPHHASQETAFNLLGLSTDEKSVEVLAEDNVKDFAKNIAAQTITTSAERVKIWGHPAEHLLSFFWDRLSRTNYYSDPALAPSNRHFYTAHFDGKEYDVQDPTDTKNTLKWPPSKNWYTLQTDANIFTTLYFLIDRQNTERYDWCAILPPATSPLATAGLTTADKKRQPPTPYLGVTWQFSLDDKGTKKVDPAEHHHLPKAGLPIGILGRTAPPLPSAAPAHAPTSVVAGRRTLPGPGRNFTGAPASIRALGSPGVARPGLRGLLQLP